MNLNLNLNRDISLHVNNMDPASASRKKYDVFISFRGEDTRKNFTSHLHKALLREKIETYIDDRLVRGDEISQSLLDAIEDSQISVVIFSQNYANSSWCLDELVHILHCKKNNNQIVVPVFYHVTPSDVRKQQGSYAASFARLDERFKDNIIHQWRTALTTASNLSGYDASNSRTDSELVESIVNDIMEKLKKLNPTFSRDHLKGLFGVQKCIEDVKSLFSHAPIVGIWGMGGLGKTTLAKAIFKQFHPYFEGHCFLENVREEWGRKGKIDMRKFFYSELLNETVLNSGNLQSVMSRLHRKKLLIVLDDVDDLKLYEDLVEDCGWLNSESRIIITSRDQQVLRSIIGVNKDIYNLKELNEWNALQLFCFHAFKRNFATENDLKMSRVFVKYAHGVPLALKVLGSHLYSKGKGEWASELHKLEVVPNNKIIGVLEISFDGLDPKQKEIFLDIACFFQGRSRDFAEKILDDGGCFASVIRDLVDKSLIIVDDYNMLSMHHLLQEMGWKIARGHKEIQNHSRLWIWDHINHVFKNNIGTATIEGIFLNHGSYNFRNIEDLYLEPDVFQKMPSLRLLHIDCCTCRFHFPQGLHSFPDQLRYLRWTNCPLDSLGSHFIPRNLVYLNMRCSQLEKLRNEFQPGPKNLKYIDLSFSKKLACLPDLSQVSLKRLDLEGCTSLVELPPLWFQNVFDKLTKEETNVKDSCDQKIRDGILNTESFINDTDDFILNLKECSKLKILSKISGTIKYICLHSTAIEELHSSIGSLNNLVFINLKDCKCLKNLPTTICRLGSLKYIDMSGCLSIDTFPHLPKNIRALDLSGTSIGQVISSSFECLPCLNILYMRDCRRLESLPGSICKLKSLTRLGLAGCSQLKSFPDILEPMENLEVLVLSGTGIKGIPSSIKSLPRLKCLSLRRCKNLEYVPTSIYYLYNLNYVEAFECPRLQSVSHDSLSMFPMLDPSGSTVGESPFFINQMLREFKCKSCCAGKSVSFVLKIDDKDKDSHTSWCTFWRHFTCCECFIFYMVHDILLSQYFHEKVLQGKQDLGHPGMSFCYPGNKIPHWFTHQSMGSSINVNFSSPRQNTSFLGFALCVVVDFRHRFSHPHYLDLACACFLKDGTTKSRWIALRRHDAHSDNDFNSAKNILDSSSDLVFIFHLYTDCDYRYCEGTRVFCKFNAVGPSIAGFGNQGVKQCGIRMLFRQDPKELHFIEHVRGENIKSDTNEPHPKRIRL